MNDARQQNDIEHLRLIAVWLDNRFRIPGTDIRFGLDSVIGLLPVVGDSVSAVCGAYFIRRAHQMGVPTSLKAKIATNVFVDLLVGSVPILGDLFDVGFKSHMRNLKLLEAFQARELDGEAIKLHHAPRHCQRILG